jgi:hypothetical protein
VSFEDRQDLLGHMSGRITTHYSAPELAAAERVCEDESREARAITLPGDVRYEEIVANLLIYLRIYAGCRVRTRDPLITNQVLYQLS